MRTAARSLERRRQFANALPCVIAQVAAIGLINVQSAVGAVVWAAAKKITLQTSGGAQMVFSAAGITVQCPGKITVHAAQKSMVGPGSESYPLDVLPAYSMKLRSRFPVSR